MRGKNLSMKKEKQFSPEKKRHIFFRFLIPYLLLLLIVLGVGIVGYQVTLLAVKKNAIEVNNTVLAQSSHMVDRYLEEVDTLVKQVSLNQQVGHILYLKKPLTSAQQYQVAQLRQEISTYGILNDFVSLFYIYFHNSDTIITPDTAYRNSSLFFQDYISSSSLTYEDWIDQVFPPRSPGSFYSGDQIRTGGVQRDVITAVYPLPLGYPESEWKASIMVHIDENEIQKLLEPLYIESGGWFYITDPDGNVLTSSLEDTASVLLNSNEMPHISGYLEKEIAGQKFILSYITSQSGWTYVVALPFHVVMESASAVQRTTLFAFFLLLLIGILIAFYFSYRNSRPLSRLLETVSSHYTSDHSWLDRRDSFATIENVLNEIFDQNHDLQVKLEQHLPLLESAFFDQLFSGGFSSLEELNIRSEHCGLHLEGDGFLCCLIQFGEYRQNLDKEELELMDKRKVLLREILNPLQEMPWQFYFHDDGGDKTVILFSYYGEWREKTNLFSTMAETVWQSINNVFGNTFYCAFGQICDSPLEIYKSYSDAVRTMEYNMAVSPSKRFSFYNEPPTDQATFFYPLEMEAHLSMFVKSGKKAEAEKLLMEIYQININQRSLSRRMLKQLLSEIQGTAWKLSGLVGFEPDPSSMAFNNDLPHGEKEAFSERFNEILILFEDLCDTANLQKKSHNSELQQNILAYINDHFQDSQLSLASVAGVFHISEAYLSSFFKEQTGENFSRFVERKRIEHACGLLQEGKWTINEIAEQCGYNSAQSFRRAFKRIKNINPSDL